MRQFILCASFITMVAAPALAQERGAASPDPQPRAAVIVDEEAGIIRFIVDGKEAARIDARGLHVVGEVQYGGTLTDSGGAYIEDYMARGGHAQ